MTRHFSSITLAVTGYEFDGWSLPKVQAPAQVLPASSPVKSWCNSGNTVKISSLPMTGSSLGLAQSIVNGIKQLMRVNQLPAQGQDRIWDPRWCHCCWKMAGAGNLKRQPSRCWSVRCCLDRSLQPGAAAIDSSPKPSRFSHGQPANTYPGLTKPGRQMSQTFTTPMASATTPELSQLMTFKGL